MHDVRHHPAAGPMTGSGPPAHRGAARFPRALRRGDRVAVVSPCGPVLDHERLDQGMALLASWGLVPVEGPNARTVAGHLAGSDDQRASDLNAAIAARDVRAIWITRGGYGLTRLLDRIDWAALAVAPTLLVGFSDVSALLVAAWRRSGVVSVHGHVVGALAAQPSAAREHLRATVFGEHTAPPIRGTAMPGTPPGRVHAPLIGGNLTVLAALAGTPDQVDAGGSVLLLEEVGEAPYRVDRLLTQLRRSGAFAGVAGIAVGAPVGCDPPPSRPSATVAEVLAERLGDLGVPVITDLPIGHMPDQRAVLHGGRVTLDGTTWTLSFRDRLPTAEPRQGSG